ncbi:helix-turn-helix domain-containing protein [Streptomyces sp. NPDC054933]
MITDAVRRADRPVTASERAAQLGPSRPTAQRYLAELSGDGAVRCGWSRATAPPGARSTCTGGTPRERSGVGGRPGGPRSHLL